MVFLVIMRLPDRMEIQQLQTPLVLKIKKKRGHSRIMQI